MKRSRSRLALTVLAPAVLGIGVTACTQGAGTPSQTASLRTTTTSPAPAATSPSSSTQTTASTGTTAPKVPTAQVRLATSKPGRAVSSAACQAEKRWGTGTKAQGGTAMSPSALYLTRAGRHACYDRVVFDINGPQALSFVARYVPVVRADGSGHKVTVPGRAALEVIVRAPILGADSQGHQPGRTVPPVGKNVVAPSQITGWSSLRAVKFAGSFEGQTTMAVGVRERLPFRLFATTKGSYRHVVLDIAH